MSITDLDLDRCLCLYGNGSQLLDCFELARQAGVASFTAVPLAAAPTAHDAASAQEARRLGIDWYESLPAMLDGINDGLLAPLGPEVSIPAALPPGIVPLPHTASAMFFRMLAHCASNGIAPPDSDQSRRSLAMALDRMDAELALLTPDGQILDGNTVLAERLGRPRNALAGLKAATVFPDFPDLTAPNPQGGTLLEELHQGRKVSRDHSQVDPHGHLHFFRTTFYPVPNQDGLLGELVVARRDITRDMFLQQRLKDSERLAAINELSMFISHEIRNPMFAISGFANALIRAKDLSEACREKAAIILAESKRLDGILKDIINFARPMTAKPGESDVGVVVRRTLGLMRLGLRSQHIVVKLHLDPGTPKAQGDPDTLLQCLLNCLNNAKEAMPDGGIITVTSGCRENWIVVTIADTGHGIPPEVLPQVFNPFFTTRNKRTGLGLAMTKKILEDLGGSVEIETEPEQGTRVTLFLPPSLELPNEEV